MKTPFHILLMPDENYLKTCQEGSFTHKGFQLKQVVSKRVQPVTLCIPCVYLVCTLCVPCVFMNIQSTHKVYSFYTDFILKRQGEYRTDTAGSMLIIGSVLFGGITRKIFRDYRFFK